MIRCSKTDFYASPEEIDRLFACNRISAMIWNKCLDIAKQYRNANDGKWISYDNLQRHLKGLYPLNSQSVQAVAERYCDARKATKEARDKGHLNIKYPWKYKHAYPTRWKQCFKLHGSQLELVLGTWSHHRIKPLKVELPSSIAELLADKKIKQIDLIWDNRLMLAFCYDDGKSLNDSRDGVCAGMDLGEIHSIVASTEEGYATIITGRKLRSINRFKNKKLKEISIKQSRCKKYSRKWKKLQQAKRWILHKAEAQVRDLTHKITKNFVDWAVDHNVKHVYCGNPEGVQRNTSKRNKKRKRKCSKKTNQKLSNWNFGTVMKYLEYKLAAKRISFEKISEAYSTQTCPVCGRRKKPSGRTYSCECGYREHRDVHGSHNILSLGLHGKFQYIGTIKKTKYLRSA